VLTGLVERGEVGFLSRLGVGCLRGRRRLALARQLLAAVYGDRLQPPSLLVVQAAKGEPLR